MLGQRWAVAPTRSARLAGAGALELIDEHDVAGNLVPAQRVADVLAELLGCDGTGRHHLGGKAFAELVVSHCEYRNFSHGRVGCDQVLDFAWIHVLTAGDDHVVDPPDDEQPAGPIQVAQVAGAHQIPHDLPAAAARVPVESQPTADVDLPHPVRRHGRPNLVEYGDDDAMSGPAHRAGGGSQVGGRGESGPAHLGRAVEVEQDVAELGHDRLGQVRTQRRRARDDHPQRTGVAGGALSRRQRHHPLQQDRNTGQHRRRVLLHHVERIVRAAAAAQDRRAAQRERGGQKAEPEPVEQRRLDHHRLARTQPQAGQQARHRQAHAQVRNIARCTFRHPSGPRRQHHQPSPLVRERRRWRTARRDRRQVRAGDPPTGESALLEHRPELLVMDDGRHRFPLEHSRQGRGAEIGAEEDQIRAKARAGDSGEDEVTMVAAQDAEPIALAQGTGLAEPIRRCRRRSVQLGIGQAAALVENRRTLRPANAGQFGGGRQRQAEAGNGSPRSNRSRR